MWTIRREQVETFQRAALRRFEDRMVEHLQSFAAKHWQAMGEADGRHVIRSGIERARRHGFTYCGPVRFYIELMFMFGGYFDTDIQHPWAGAVLQDRVYTDQMVRADRLHDAMNQYLIQISGPNNEYPHEAMRRLRDSWIKKFILPGEDLKAGIMRGLRAIDPLKCDYLGPAVLGAVVNQGLDLAFRHGFFDEKGRVLMVALSFALGHGFHEDPLYGWITRRLEPKQRPNAVDRADHLYIAAMTYLEEIIVGSEA